MTITHDELLSLGFIHHGQSIIGERYYLDVPFPGAPPAGALKLMAYPSFDYMEEDQNSFDSITWDCEKNGESVSYGQHRDGNSSQCKELTVDVVCNLVNEWRAKDVSEDRSVAGGVE